MRTAKNTVAPSRPGKLVKPMLATASDRSPFRDEDWLFEIKWDGYRAIAEIDATGNRLYSRNGLSFAGTYGPVFQALAQLPEGLTLDGEIVVLDSEGKPNFQLLQNYRDTGAGALRYVVFDCLRFEGRNVRSLPLTERKKLAKAVLPQTGILQYCDDVDENGVALFREARRYHLEGIIAKRKKSLYTDGKRSADWLKIKNVKSEEVVIVGFTPPKGSRIKFGSLLLAQFHRGKLRYSGNVGTGFSIATLKKLHAQLIPLKRTTSPLGYPAKVPVSVTWVEPVVVANIRYTERTADGIFRHPVFLGVRVDKAPQDVRA